MKFTTPQIKEIITALGFTRQNGSKEIYYKDYAKHDEYVIKVNFDTENIEYGTKIRLGDLTTSHFENSENLVVLECVDRLLEKDYPPSCLILEQKWPMGRKEKGKLDVLVQDNAEKTYLMIECKTWGDEYEREKKKMQRDGAQLFSYFQQDKAAQYLCLYTSRLHNGRIEFVNDIIHVDEQWRSLNNQKEVFDHWNKNFKDNGIFEDWAHPYDVEIKALTRGRLKELTEEDSGRIFNQFAEILRHNVVSDKPNAFNKIFNLFLCKIRDEDRTPEEELHFQWLENDTDEALQKRLSDLYKQGMKEYLAKDVTDYNDEQVAEKLYALDAAVREQIREMFARVRLHKNNEFAFKEVFDEKSFRENAVVVREVVELLQPYQLRYGHKQQFLGDFFELLLSTGIKQEAGQFFTPVPVAKFIISSFPVGELIQRKIQNDETNFLPYIIDYAAGSGHFLTEAMDEVQQIIEGIDPKLQRPSVKAKLNSWREGPFDWAAEYVYGIEADYRLVKTAKVSCFLNGDGVANVIHADGLDHFKKSAEFKGKLKQTSSEDPQDNGQFDVLVANPPYSVAAFKNTLKHGDESFKLFNRLTDDSSEIECLFIERTKQLVKPGGWAGIILPSSILTSTGIYSDARDIILKYFDLKAIAEFGSSTFMATGTNTVTLFLERKLNSAWKIVESAIKTFFDDGKDATVNGVENAFSAYVSNVYKDIELSDYLSFTSKSPNPKMQAQELYASYQGWFLASNEVKQIQEKKLFKSRSEDAQKAELDKLFYEKVFAREQERMLHYFLTLPQKTVLIRVGDKQFERDFIGYEFSNRRGREGIKMYRDKEKKLTTKLYDIENPLNPKKANSYIHNAFLGKTPDSIDESLAENISIANTHELLDFTKLHFDKSISLNVKKNEKRDSKWELRRIGAVLKPVTGNTTKISDSEIQESGATAVVTQESGKLISGYTNDKRTITDLPLIVFGDHNCTFKYVDFEFVRGADGTQLLKPNDEFLPKYFYHALGTVDITNRNKYERHFKYLKDGYIPAPPLSIQKTIVDEIELIEQSKKDQVDKLKSMKSELDLIFLNLPYEHYKLGTLVEFKNGLNYSEKSTGDLVTIVGVKDFLENFSPDLDNLAKVRIEGTLSDGLKLQPKDILVVRSNGSAKLVGRFIYIEKVKDDMGHSGFTIRLRVTSDRIDPKFLCYCLRTETVRNLITKDPKGSNIKSVNQGMLSAIEIPLPDMNVQRQIIDKARDLENAMNMIETDIANSDVEKGEVLRKYLG